jgi:hypothetical protein
MLITLAPGYSERMKTGSIQKPDIFVPGFQMATQHPISGLVFEWSASLDCFIHKRF